MARILNGKLNTEKYTTKYQAHHLKTPSACDCHYRLLKQKQQMFYAITAALDNPSSSGLVVLSHN